MKVDTDLGVLRWGVSTDCPVWRPRYVRLHSVSESLVRLYRPYRFGKCIEL